MRVCRLREDRNDPTLAEEEALERRRFSMRCGAGWKDDFRRRATKLGRGCFDERADLDSIFGELKAGRRAVAGVTGEPKVDVTGEVGE